MKKTVVALFSLVLLLALPACDNGEQIPNAVGGSSSPGQEEQTSGQPTNPDSQYIEDGVGSGDQDALSPLITVEEEALNIYDSIVSDIQSLIISQPLPSIAPRNEKCIEDLRAWMAANNDRDTPTKFDPEDLSMSDYGYRLTLYSPVDFWGNKVYLWVQETPYGHQDVVVSVGQDGVATYNGYGGDYSVGGFGDDSVTLLNYS